MCNLCKFNCWLIIEAILRNARCNSKVYSYVKMCNIFMNISEDKTELILWSFPLKFYNHFSHQNLVIKHRPSVLYFKTGTIPNSRCAFITQQSLLKARNKSRRMTDVSTSKWMTCYSRHSVWTEQFECNFNIDTVLVLLNKNVYLTQRVVVW